jgi:hypothetical protein
MVQPLLPKKKLFRKHVKEQEKKSRIRKHANVSNTQRLKGILADLRLNVNTMGWRK